MTIAVGLIAPAVIALAIFARRYWLGYQEKMHALHVRVLRSELLQALARGNQNFLIEHWSKRDRAAALDIAAQLLGLLKGRDRERLQEIVEDNRVLEKPLMRINRWSANKRIAAIRRLSAFGNQSVQGTLHSMMEHDPNPHVRLEAAIAISVAGTLPPVWKVFRSTVQDGQPLTPNHYSLLRSLVPTRYESIQAMAALQDNVHARILAIDAIGYAEDHNHDQAEKTLGELALHPSSEIAEAAQKSLDYLQARDRSVLSAKIRAHRAQHASGAKLAAGS